MARATAACLVIALLGSVFTVEAFAQSAPSAVNTPALASGRSPDDPAAITAGDVLARALLLRENLGLIRAYMGAPPADPPLIRGRQATMGEAYFGALSVAVRIQQLAFEQLRTERPWRRPQLPNKKVVAADVWHLVDPALANVLKVKRGLGIKTEPPERQQADDTNPTELFNLLLTMAGEIESMLEERVRGVNAYVISTVLIHQSMVLHLTDTKKMMPNEPAFEPNKTPEDVFGELMKCFSMVSEIAHAFDLPVVRIERVSTVQRTATINDLVDLGILMLAELDQLIVARKLKRSLISELAPDRKYPSHILPRVKLLRAVLTDVRDAQQKKKGAK